jgi:hypothetical protein
MSLPTCPKLLTHASTVQEALKMAHLEKDDVFLDIGEKGPEVIIPISCL